MFLCEAVVMLTLKVGKVCSLTTNYRPISLTTFVCTANEQMLPVSMSQPWKVGILCGSNIVNKILTIW